MLSTPLPPHFGVVLGFYSFFSLVILRREGEQEEASPPEERGCWGNALSVRKGVGTRCHSQFHPPTCQLHLPAGVLLRLGGAGYLGLSLLAGASIFRSRILVSGA